MFLFGQLKLNLLTNTLGSTRREVSLLSFPFSHSPISFISMFFISASLIHHHYIRCISCSW
ncbi:hypothetical protein Sarmat_00088 [Rickettsiales endosymbiont of Paramecium tredecaurelia]|nr:hypothetical protein [Candidatus Sarmatiella mevalonica]